MNFDFVHGGMPHPRPVVENPFTSPSMPMQYRSETSWSHTATPSSSMDQRFENGTSWDLECQTHSAEMLLPFLSDDLFAGGAFPLPYSSCTAIGDPGFREVALDSLALFPDQAGSRSSCNIEAKPTLSFPDVLETVESNVVAIQGARNFGRRRGPLNPKAKEGANKVRKIRACANCRIKKIRVSQSPYP